MRQGPGRPKIGKSQRAAPREPCIDYYYIPLTLGRHQQHTFSIWGTRAGRGSALTYSSETTSTVSIPRSAQTPPSAV
jgi:hypothetical protein